MKDLMHEGNAEEATVPVFGSGHDHDHARTRSERTRREGTRGSLELPEPGRTVVIGDTVIVGLDRPGSYVLRRVS